MKTQQYAFHFDASRCTGCKTCVVACKDKNNIQDPKIQFRRVYEEAGGEWEQEEETKAWTQNVWAYFVSVSCNHCDNPACVKVCPTGAHAKHDELGGLVLIDHDKCIGCGACAIACPYEAPQLDRKAKKMRKCDMCIDRISKKELPVCVAACPQRALDFGTVESLQKKHGDDGMIAPLAAGDYTLPNLLIRRCAQAQKAPERTRSWPEFINDGYEPDSLVKSF